MIRNAVIHLANEQPLLADVYEMPSPSHQSLVCTNLRTMAGKRPVFADHTDSVFVFPYGHIRFVEIPAASLGDLATGVRTDDRPTEPEPEPVPEPDLELDEDFLRRIREV